MKLELWLTGKTTYTFIEEGMSIYEKRIGNYIPFCTQTIPHPKGNLNPDELKRKEAELILKKLEPQDALYLFDERGKTYSSPEFAKFTERLLDSSTRRTVLLIGGAYGFTREIYDRAQGKISLSEMTFSHQIIRVLILEQIYRAMTILRNEPYHHA